MSKFDAVADIAKGRGWTLAHGHGCFKYSLRRGSQLVPVDSLQEALTFTRETMRRNASMPLAYVDLSPLVESGLISSPEERKMCSNRIHWES